ncbi:UPF0236 family transposase-like protein [Bacillus sp. 2205SS5-2]|uniref:UPF0236 family transposase-like protein n=1 Tax=Bacillus sp. 2205SS5-2 TaxID=3109031 RepID=UPI003003FB46
MKKDNINHPNLKELEQVVWRELQKTYSQIMTSLLSDIDDTIAKERDTKRYRHQDKRTVKLVSLLGEIEVNRNYYRDRESGEYVYLLDRYLEFEGAGDLVP